MADEDTPLVRTCSTMVVHERLLRSDPEYVRARVASENRAFEVATLGDEAGRSGVTVIPVVVHVVYKTADQDLDMAQIQSQIDVLNRDFRKANSDVGDIPAPF